MSNSSTYTSSGSINTTPGTAYTYYPPGSPNYSYTGAGAGARTVDIFYDPVGRAGLTTATSNFQYSQYAPGTTVYTGPYSPYTTNSGESSYGQGPKPVSAGFCPEGFHWMSDSGGWCMSNGITYTPTSTAASVSPSTSNSGYGGTPNYYNTGYGAPYNPSAPYYWGSAPTNYSTFAPPGSNYGTGPSPVSPGVCPAGYHWMFDSGGWCMSDGGTYTPASPGSPYPANSPGSAGYYSCSAGYYWNGSSCASPTGPSGYSQGGCGNNYYWSGSSCVQYYGQANSTNPSGGCNSGFYWNGFGCVSNSTNCGSGYWWNGSGCSPSSGSYSTYGTGPVPTSSGSCPSGYHWMSDSGGWCMSNGDSSTSSGSTTTGSSCGSGYYWNGSSCVQSSSGGSSTSSGSCPSGYHWMSDNGGYCMADGGSSSTPSSPAPASSPEPAPASSPEPAPQPSP